MGDGPNSPYIDARIAGLVPGMRSAVAGVIEMEELRAKLQILGLTSDEIAQVEARADHPLVGLRLRYDEVIRGDVSALSDLSSLGLPRRFSPMETVGRVGRWVASLWRRHLCVMCWRWAGSDLLCRRHRCGSTS